MPACDANDILSARFESDGDNVTVKCINMESSTGEPDTITVSYFDKENTDPGVAIERSYAVAEAGSSKPKPTVYRTTVQLVEDTGRSAQAKIRQLRMRGKQT